MEKNLCQSLSKAERDRSFSSAKKKRSKKPLKPVLASPFSTNLSSEVLTFQAVSNVEELLKKYLPDANLSKPNARLLRKELALGVNAVYRHLEKDIAAVILDSNIQPILLVSHLISKSVKMKIPYVQLNLRQITQNHLDFECIAIGIKKEANHFENVVNAIKQSCVYKIAVEEVKEVTIADNVSPTTPIPSSSPLGTKTFQYLKRPAGQPERVFVCPQSNEEKDNNDFIPVSKEPFSFNENLPKGISLSMLKSKKRKFDSSKEERTVKKKKGNKNWTIEKRGMQSKKYLAAKVQKIVPNENRKKQRKGMIKKPKK